MSVWPSRPWAARAHALTAVVAIFGLVLQLVLVIIGNPVLAEVEPPGLGLRIGRFLSYFTVESNLLIAVAAVMLARDPARDGPGWRVLRLAGLVAITVTALVHFFLLRPLLDLHGLDRVADTLLHLVVPALALFVWAVLDPRPHLSPRIAVLTLGFPLGWAVWTMIVGAISGWYPYPFLDPAEEGWVAVVVALVAITIVFVTLLAGAVALSARRTSATR